MKLLTLAENSQRARILALVLSELGFVTVKAFQKKEGIDDDGVVGEQTFARLYARYLNVKEYSIAGNYWQEVYEKKQIVWHHSAGWDNARLMFQSWVNDGRKHVATAIGISDSGEIIRGYDEKFWAVHIGAYDIGLLNYMALETQSVAVEICNWGALEERNGKFYAWVNDYGKRGPAVELPKEKVIELNYKGIRYFEAYTDAEIESLRRWTILMAIRFDIPLNYNAKDFWQASQNAISGKAGLYSHNSFVSWKTDVSPQPKLIAMAEKLAKI